MLKDGLGNLKIYSLGIVTVDKPRTTDDIEVCPIEELSLTDGKISDIEKPYETSLLDAGDVGAKSKAKSGATLTAKWIPYGHSNRITSPDVIKNETVLLFRFADTDEYYWTTIFREPQIRRLETVCYMYGDLTEPLKQWDKESSYWLEYSTHDQHIHLHTSKSNKEPYIYDVRIDTKEGYIEVKDDVGNFIKFDSAKTDIRIENADKSYIDLDRDCVHIRAENMITLRAPIINQGTYGDDNRV